MTAPRPGIFKLPSFKLREKGAQAGRMSQITYQLASSDRRIVEQTPSLKKLEELLARPVP